MNSSGKAAHRMWYGLDTEVSRPRQVCCFKFKRRKENARIRELLELEPVNYQER